MQLVLRYLFAFCELNTKFLDLVISLFREEKNCINCCVDGLIQEFSIFLELHRITLKFEILLKYQSKYFLTLRHLNMVIIHIFLFENLININLNYDVKITIHVQMYSSEDIILAIPNKLIILFRDDYSINYYTNTFALN